jgi:hypothetical protein
MNGWDERVPEFRSPLEQASPRRDGGHAGKKQIPEELEPQCLATAGTASPRIKSQAARPLTFHTNEPESRRGAIGKRKSGTIREDGLHGACIASTASLLKLRPDQLRAAQAAGKRLRTVSFLADKLMQGTNRLARAIPEDWLIDLMQEKRTTYLDLAPAAVLRWLQSEALDGCWCAAEITAFIRAIEHINRWLSERDLLPEDGDLGSVPTWRITSYLREYRDEKRKGFAEKSTHVRETSCAGALAEVPTAPTGRPGHT